MKDDLKKLLKAGDPAQIFGEDDCRAMQAKVLARAIETPQKSWSPRQKNRIIIPLRLAAMGLFVFVLGTATGLGLQERTVHETAVQTSKTSAATPSVLAYVSPWFY